MVVRDEQLFCQADACLISYVQAFQALNCKTCEHLPHSWRQTRLHAAAGMIPTAPGAEQAGVGCARARLVQAGQALLAGDLAEAVDHAAVLARRAVAAVHLRARARAHARLQAQSGRGGTESRQQH